MSYIAFYIEHCVEMVKSLGGVRPVQDSAESAPCMTPGLQLNKLLARLTMGTFKPIVEYINARELLLRAVL